MDRKGIRWNRRQFIAGAGSLVGSAASLGIGRAAGKGVSIALDPRDPVSRRRSRSVGRRGNWSSPSRLAA
jgi:hypothetical protein